MHRMGLNSMLVPGLQQECKVYFIDQKTKKEVPILALKFWAKVNKQKLPLFLIRILQHLEIHLAFVN